MSQEEEYMPTDRRPEATIHPPFLSTVSPGSVITHLTLHKNKGERLLKNDFLSKEESQEWIRVTKEILIRAFGSTPEFIDSVVPEGGQKAYGGFKTASILEKERRKNIAIILDNIESLLEQLNEESSKSEAVEREEIQEPEESEKSLGESSVEEGKIDLAISLEAPEIEIKKRVGNMEKTGGRKVLIIHSQDEEKAMEVADFLAKLDLSPILPYDQSSNGMNLIAELETNPEIVFAITLLTADDFGYPRGKPEEVKPRPKQNVIFDLGYLLGRMKQNLVCALYEEGLDLPSKYQGRVFIPYDADGLWRLLIARSMKLANVNVDLNKAI
jgi:predicted nucleotide-binding protein